MSPTDKERKMPLKQDTATLASLISAYAPYDGSFELRVPGVHAIKQTSANVELTHYIQPASLCVVAQGAKNAIIGDESYEYAAGQIAVFSLDVPLSSRITGRTARRCRFQSAEGGEGGVVAARKLRPGRQCR